MHLGSWLEWCALTPGIWHLFLFFIFIIKHLGFLEVMTFDRDDLEAITCLANNVIEDDRALLPSLQTLEQSWRGKSLEHFRLWFSYLCFLKEGDHKRLDDISFQQRFRKRVCSYDWEVCSYDWEVSRAMMCDQWLHAWGLLPGLYDDFIKLHHYSSSWHIKQSLRSIAS